jgi:hypothetical protein
VRTAPWLACGDAAWRVPILRLLKLGQKRRTLCHGCPIGRLNRYPILEVHLDTVGAARFSASTWSTGGFESVLRVTTLLPIAQAVQTGDPGLEARRESG